MARRPGLFTFMGLKCDKCGISIRTNIRSRLLFILSFTLLVRHHLYIRQLGQALEQSVLWIGLALVIAPLLVTFRLPRLEVGHQQSWHSVAANGVFFFVLALLAYLWVFG
ncbi:MAG: hypothetical protein R3208_22250 [Ketobacteraceae bacterium]|nr:hypothetical protein [Ketobacteraceae bacterium]